MTRLVIRTLTEEKPSGKEKPPVTTNQDTRGQAKEASEELTPAGALAAPSIGKEPAGASARGAFAQHYVLSPGG